MLYCCHDGVPRWGEDISVVVTLVMAFQLPGEILPGELCRDTNTFCKYVPAWSEGGRSLAEGRLEDIYYIMNILKAKYNQKFLRNTECTSTTASAWYGCSHLPCITLSGFWEHYSLLMLVVIRLWTSGDWCAAFIHKLLLVGASAASN